MLRINVDRGPNGICDSDWVWVAPVSGTILERTILTKQYTVNLGEFGWRTGDLFVSVEKAKSDEIAQILLSDANVISTSTRMGDLEVNVSARVYYKSTEELHHLVEKTKSIPNVRDVEWSEEVKTYHREQDVMVGTVFHHNPQESKKLRTTISLPSPVSP